MRYVLITITLLVMLFVACEKKQTPTRCYACQRYDSTFSNKPGITGPTIAGPTDTLCNQTGETIAYFMKSHIRIDTSAHYHDTVIKHYHSYGCTPQ